MFMGFFSADAKIFLLNLKENLSPKTYIKMPSKVNTIQYLYSALLPMKGRRQDYVIESKKRGMFYQKEFSLNM